MSQVTVHPPSEPPATSDFSLQTTYEDYKDPALPTSDNCQQPDLGSHLVVSPYTTFPHLLDLTSLEESQRLLANSLTVLQSIRQDYATAPYHQSFNWDAVIARLRSLRDLSDYQWQRQHFYIVVFRSQVPPTTDRTHLGELDQRSHAEATESGGLLKYWFGLPDENGRNLATCTSALLAPFQSQEPHHLTFLPRHMAQHRRRSLRQYGSRSQRGHESDH